MNGINMILSLPSPTAPDRKEKVPKVCRDEKDNWGCCAGASMYFRGCDYEEEEDRYYIDYNAVIPALLRP